jgi:probable HAF family extracellular repeat protein
MSRHLPFSILICSFILGLPSAALAATLTNITIIDFPGGPTIDTTATGINDTGQVVGYFQDSTGSQYGFGVHSFLKDGPTVTAFDVSGAPNTFASGINTAGQIVGWFTEPDSSIHGFLRAGGSDATIEVSDATPDATPGTTAANGINNVSQIVGHYSMNGRGFGFLLAGSSYTTIHDPPWTMGGGNGTAATGINTVGQIVGVSDTGFLLDGSNYTRIYVPGSLSTVPYGINDVGHIVGAYALNNVNHSFLLAGGIYTTIDVPGAMQTIVHGINNVGQIVGTFTDSTGHHGFVAQLFNCRDQVHVESFTADTTTGLNPMPVKDNTLTLNTENKNGVPGIEFKAEVTINGGEIPIDEISIRYIQNQTANALTFNYDPNPDLAQVLVAGATFPLLDREHDPPPPFYDAEFHESNPDGSKRTVMASDSPTAYGPITLTVAARNGRTAGSQ